MTHYADLSPCGYFASTEGPLLAVGWLDPDHDFARGPVTREFFDALVVLATDPWQPFAFGGRHPCGFCVFTGGPTRIQTGDASWLSMGATNVSFQRAVAELRCVRWNIYARCANTASIT